jgi:DNA mismatch endonuclease (patch repair protein)
VRREADIVFGPSKVAVFVDGCFWHMCPQHSSLPANNAAWWAAKLARNQERDEQTTAHLEGLGWTVIRIWEHVPADDAANLVDAVLEGQETVSPTPA